MEDPPPGWLADPPWLADPLAGYPTLRDGWLGRSASTLTKRTCLESVIQNVVCT